jgi:hypothetical protein
VHLLPENLRLRIRGAYVCCTFSETFLFLPPLPEFGIQESGVAGVQELRESGSLAKIFPGSRWSRIFG